MLTAFSDSVQLFTHVCQQNTGSLLICSESSQLLTPNKFSLGDQFFEDRTNEWEKRHILSLIPLTFLPSPLPLQLLRDAHQPRAIDRQINCSAQTQIQMFYKHRHSTNTDTNTVMGSIRELLFCYEKNRDLSEYDKGSHENDRIIEHFPTQKSWERIKT